MRPESQCTVQDTHAAPPLPEEPQTAPADDTAMDMDITDDGPPPAASAPASMPATATPPAAATSATVSAPVLTTAQPATAPVPKAQPAAATPLTAQIDSRIAAAVAAHPAAGSAHSGPSASAALPRPYLAPLPALAPQWPGYYQPHPPYAYPHMPYPYMPYPMPYATPQMPQAASVPLPASIPQPAAPGERHKLSTRANLNCFSHSRCSHGPWTSLSGFGVRRSVYDTSRLGMGWESVGAVTETMPCR